MQWIDVAMEESNDNISYPTKFMPPEGPSPSFKWLQQDNIYLI
jgi:hypothetical protein